jgi:hypothetical protein
VTATTLTVTGGSDYTLANTAIGSVYISKAASPVDFPGWFNYVPTIVGFSANPTNMSHSFSMQGKLTTVQWAHNTAGTSNATTYTISLPVTSATMTNASWGAKLYFAENNGVVLQSAIGRILSAATVIDLYQDSNFAVWTAAGNKRSLGEITYWAAG